MSQSKQFFNMRLKRISPVMGLVVAISFVLSLGQPPTAYGQSQIFKQLGLKSGELILIEQPSKSELGITMNGKDYMVDYTFFSNRSKNFRLMVPSETGELVEVEAPPVSTIRGTLRGMKGSSVVGCVTEQGCCARIKFPSGEDCWIEPLSRTLDNPAVAGIHVVYASRDVIEPGKMCGNVTNLAEAAQQRDAQVVDSTILGGAGTISMVQIATEADFEYFSIFRSRNDTLNHIEMLVNVVNSQFESEAQIRHEISDMIVRETSNDPWTTSDGDGLIGQLRTYYRTGPGNGTITGDLCYLFSGRNLTAIRDGSSINIGGIAGTGELCDARGGFGVVEFNEPLNYDTNALAHELGHNWGLQHCEVHTQDGCPNHTMHAGNNGSNNFHNSITVPRLIAFRDSLNCVDTRTFFGFTGPPTTNDDWANSTPISVSDFSTTGRTFGFTTEAGEQNLANVGSTAWWSLSSSSSGTMVIDTFGSDFDTQLHVYEFVPGGGFAGLVLVANNDDTSGLQSQVTFEMTAGTRYDIRVGGFRSPSLTSVGSQGNTVLNGTFTELLLTNPNCPVRVSVDQRTLVIDGTQGPDTIFVTQDRGTLIAVINNGECAAMVPIASIDLVEIQGFGGADIIRVNASVETLIGGGFGADRITGGPLSNMIMGGPGADDILGGPQDDIISAGRGNDTVLAFAGDDFIDGGDATDVIRGGSGADEIIGGIGADSLFGEGGDDILTGNVGADRLDGGAGNDSLSGLGGPDLLFGGPGNDDLRGGAGFDTLDGSSGTDTALDNGEVEISIENT